MSSAKPDPFPSLPRTPGYTSVANVSIGANTNSSGSVRSTRASPFPPSGTPPPQPHPTARAMSLATMNRKRKGSLRKAILNRGALRERRESKSGLTIDVKQSLTHGLAPPAKMPSTSPNAVSPVVGAPRFPPYSIDTQKPSFSLDLSVTSSGAAGEKGGLPSSLSRTRSTGVDGDSSTSMILPPGNLSVALAQNLSSRGLFSPGIDSTTDEDDPPLQLRPRHGKSPLSFSAAQSSPPTDWDYSETEWWGWVVLLSTWFIFVIGMGSCLGVWTWAWDVGTTPYAPPELEDDPTLPIVGYYPALIILSGVMAWLWVLVAWVGMKYFRHAKVAGD